MTRREIRRRAEDMIHELIDLIDAIDGDPDLEPETDLDFNPVSLQLANRRPPKRVTMRRAA
jgi:hypothetical protein